jgi:predicted transglutaminase-like protease
MKNSKLIIIGFLGAFGVAIYVAAVSFIMSNGEKIFGKMDNFLGPVAFLLLFVLSAAITGALVLGRPILWYLENRRLEAVKLFLCTLGWLFAITLAVFTALALIK